MMDLFFGSKRGLATCMAYKCHCAAVEIDPCQAMVLKKRVLALEEKESLNF
jgi:hypothetical protein